MPPVEATQEVLQLVDRYRQKWGRVKVDVGCGVHPRGEDYITVDKHVGSKVTAPVAIQEGSVMKEGLAEVEVKADIEADMWKLPFHDATVDELWCSHALEHAPVGKVIDTLREFHRVLKAGGRCIVTVPNFDYVAKYWLLGSDRRWAEMLVMGSQQTEGEFHRSCFNADLLKGDMEGVGFKLKVLKIVWTHGQECLQAVALKP